MGKKVSLPRKHRSPQGYSIRSCMLDNIDPEQIRNGK